MQTSSGERATGEDEKIPPTEYRIHGAGLKGNLTIGTVENSGAQPPLFSFDQESMEQIVPVSNS